MRLSRSTGNKLILQFQFWVIWLTASPIQYSHFASTRQFHPILGLTVATTYWVTCWANCEQKLIKYWASGFHFVGEKGLGMRQRLQKKEKLQKWEYYLTWFYWILVLQVISSSVQQTVKTNCGVTCSCLKSLWPQQSDLGEANWFQRHHQLTNWCSWSNRTKHLFTTAIQALEMFLWKLYVVSGQLGFILWV